MKIDSVHSEEKSKHCKKCDQETNHTVSVGTKKEGLISMAIDEIPGMDIIDMAKDTLSSGNYGMKAFELSVCSVCDTKEAKKVTDEVYTELMLKGAEIQNKEILSEIQNKEILSDGSSSTSEVASEIKDDLKNQLEEAGVSKGIFAKMFKLAKWIIIILIASIAIMVFLG